MTLRSWHRTAIRRNQPIQVSKKSWDPEFKAQIWITPHGRWWVKKKDGSRFEARFTATEWMAKDWIEASICENTRLDGISSSEEGSCSSPAT